MCSYDVLASDLANIYPNVWNVLNRTRVSKRKIESRHSIQKQKWNLEIANRNVGDLFWETKTRHIGHDFSIWFIFYVIHMSVNSIVRRNSIRFSR